MSSRPRVRRWGLACLVTSGAVALGLATGATATAAGGQATGGATSPFDRARRAALTVSYTGTITVRWTDTAGAHAASMQVEAGAGVVKVDGQAKMAATASQRWAFRHGDWDLMSPAGLGQLAVPATGKYAYTSTPGPIVAGRPTDLAVLTVGRRVDERWYLDDETGLLLRREQVDGHGAGVRSVGFDALTVRPPQALPTPVASVDLRPRLAGHLQAPLVAPSGLAGDYRKVGMYRRAGVLQVVYSDGVHGLSVFEQPGRLDRSSMPPGGRAVAVGPGGGVQWVYAGGQVVVWQAAGSTVTVVGDGAPDEVLAASRSVPSGRSGSVVARLRRACSQVVDAVSGP